MEKSGLIRHRLFTTIDKAPAIDRTFATKKPSTFIAPFSLEEDLDRTKVISKYSRMITETALTHDRYNIYAGVKLGNCIVSEIFWTAHDWCPLRLNISTSLPKGSSK